MRRSAKRAWWMVVVLVATVASTSLALSAGTAWSTTVVLSATKCNVDLSVGTGWVNVACDYVGTDLTGGAHLTNLTQANSAFSAISQDSLGSYWTGHLWGPCCTPDASLDGDLRAAFQQASTGSWVTGTIVSVTRTGTMPAAPVDTTTTTTTTTVAATTTTTVATTTTTVPSTTTTASVTTTTFGGTTTTGVLGSLSNPMIVSVGGEQSGLLWLLSGMLATAFGVGFFRLLWGRRDDG